MPARVHEALAINEVSLLRETRFAAKLRIEIDGVVRMPEMICDGVLLATPAGSTAYNRLGERPDPAAERARAGADADQRLPAAAVARRHPAASCRRSPSRCSIPELRPVSAVADYTEVRDVVRVVVREDRSVALTLLFDPEHNLEERIVKEQFLL